jgi:dihydroorotate dehydrogenase
LIYKKIIKRLLFLMKAEKAHELTMLVLNFTIRFPFLKTIFKKIYAYEHPKLEKVIAGMKFTNPLGMAAGFDKNGQYVESLHAMGFGFVEVGTVTPLPQPGNSKPRLFRLKEDEALINRMGFNNEGVEVLVSRLKSLKKPEGLIIGGNIGKNKVTPNETAVDDYIICYDALYDYVDYFAINISSPNTPGLRELQSQEPLEQLLKALTEKNRAQSNPKPLFLKIAPDLTDTQLDEILIICEKYALKGIIATNTTISRANLSKAESDLNEIGDGGLSGAPLGKRSTEVVKYIRTKCGDRFVIIGVGGVNSPETAQEKIEAGADLVQIYTGMIYEGPGLISKILKAMI